MLLRIQFQLHVMMSEAIRAGVVTSVVCRPRLVGKVTPRGAHLKDPPDLKDPLFSSKFDTLIIKTPKTGFFGGLELNAYIRIVSTAILEDF